MSQGFDIAVPGVQGQANVPMRFIECSTCDGHRMVLVATRSPQMTPWMQQHGLKPNVATGLEEYAPCPECNSPCNTDRRDISGRLIQCPDADRTRELLRS